MISGLALAIAVYVIVIPTLTERHDVSQILLFSPLLRVITFVQPFAALGTVVMRVRFIKIS